MSTTNDPKAQKSNKKHFERLSKDAVPVHYDVALQADMRTAAQGGTFRFKGHVAVLVDISADAGVQELTCNAAELDLTEAWVVDSEGTRHAAEIRVDAATETATFSTGKTLGKGRVTLNVAYWGTLNDKMKGFYRSTYAQEDAQTGAKVSKLMAVTQFEPTDARRALPCWDEPAMKATFSVTLTVPKSQKAVSNMPIIKSVDEAVNDYSVFANVKSANPDDAKTNETAKKNEEQWVTHTYDRSPIMSTYLLAFIIGEFDSIEAKTKNGVVVRCFTPVGKKELGEFALDVAVKSLPFYAEYFGIGYPLPKLDMLAIADFSAGAMENWGAVTYREIAILVDRKQSSAARKQQVALTVAHELAHQWFGNLVTMEWWTHLWLNEGFATWIEYLAVDHIFPEWQIWSQFLSHDAARALSLDSLASSHPIEVEVGHPDEIDEIFDMISYSKGSCVIRMLAEFLGKETFRKGLVRYLARHRYGNTFTEDLWRALAEESGQPVEDVMRTWTKQTGFPVLSVALDAATQQLVVKQERFLRSGPVPEDPKLWAVPVSIYVALPDGKSTVVNQLVREREATIDLTAAVGDAGAIDFVKLNVGQTGIYRVNYDDASRGKLIDAVVNRDARLSSDDRFGFESDTFDLARSGFIPVTVALDVLMAFAPKEDDYTVWANICDDLADLQRILRTDEALYADFKVKYGQKLFAAVSERVGWGPSIDGNNDDAAESKEDEDHLVRMLRERVVAKMCGFDHKPTVDEAIKRFDKFFALATSKKGGDSDPQAALILPPDMRTSVYSVAIRERGKAGYDQVWQLFQQAELHEEKVRCLFSLGAATSRELIERNLNLALEGKDVRPQDAFFVFRAVFANSKANEIAWQFVQKNWDEIVAKFGSSFILARIVGGLDSFASNAKADEIEAFFKDRETPAADRALLQSLEKIRSNAAWLARDHDKVKQYLASAK